MNAVSAMVLPAKFHRCDPQFAQVLVQGFEIIQRDPGVKLARRLRRQLPHHQRANLQLLKVW